MALELETTLCRTCLMATIFPMPRSFASTTEP